MEHGLEEVGLALGLSLGSGHNQQQPSPSSQPCVLEPSLSLSLPAVKRELRTMEEDEDEAAATDNGRAPSSSAVEEEEAGCSSRKKLRLSKEQSALLEERFKEHSTLNPKQKAALAKQLNLRPRQVEVWFQNRRARTKLKQTEVDCELLKRCCETLTEENRRLQRELQQLRALKHQGAAAFFMPAALCICPSCDREHLTRAPEPKPGPAAHFLSPFTNRSAA